MPTGGAAITPAFGELLMCYTHIARYAPFFDKAITCSAGGANLRHVILQHSLLQMRLASAF